MRNDYIDRSYNERVVLSGLDEIRYRQQQEFLNDMAYELGVVAFRPDYHRKKGDKNTVLFYTIEENKKAEWMLKNHYDQLSPDFPRPFWSFENTDVNGRFSLDYANFGRFGLRVEDEFWQHRMFFTVKLALVKRKRTLYVTKAGGYGGIYEADETYNDFNRQIIDAMWRIDDKAYIGKFHCFDGERDAVVSGKISPLKKYEGEKVYNFGADFAIPKYDETLCEMLARLNTPGECTAANIEAIQKRIEWLGGECFIWF